MVLFKIFTIQSLCHYIHYLLKKEEDEVDKRNDTSYVSFKIRKIYYFFVVTVRNEFCRKEEIEAIIQLDEYTPFVHSNIVICSVMSFLDASLRSKSLRKVPYRWMQTNANEMRKTFQIFCLYLSLN